MFAEKKEKYSRKLKMSNRRGGGVKLALKNSFTAVQKITNRK
jgi:hypothetical protein